MSTRSFSDSSGDAVVVRDLVKKFKIPHEKKKTIYDHVFGLVKGGSYLVRRIGCARQGLIHHR